MLAAATSALICAPPEVGRSEPVIVTQGGVGEPETKAQRRAVANIVWQHALAEVQRR